MSYITVETDIDLDDYSDEIISMFKRNKRFRENLLQEMVDQDVIVVRDKKKKGENYDDAQKQLTKIIQNYWKLSSEEEELLLKIADRF
jgi:hypothetical protein